MKILHPGKKHEPVAIGRIERHCADWELARGTFQRAAPPPGRLPLSVQSFGLTCAADLAKADTGVTVFEAPYAAYGV